MKKMGEISRELEELLSKQKSLQEFYDENF